MRVHFIAVAGTGMGALAGLFKAAGHEVTGSDVAFYPPMGPALERWGIALMTGFDPAHLDEARPDLVVIGNVCRPTNPEASHARASGLRTTTMAHALAEHILEGTSPLVVGGTHGKTTTTAIAAWLLHAAGRDPGFLIGGIPKNFDQSFRLGAARAPRRLPLAGGASNTSTAGSSTRDPPFVVEGDEYDTAFFEKTPKFWHYRPEVAVVTSIEHDHVDIYPDLASYHAAFRGFVERVPPQGLIVAAAADAAVVDIVSRAARAEVAWFALEGDDTHGQPPHWLAAPVTADANGQTFDLFAGGVFAGRVGMRIPGHHNVRNALAAIASVVQGYRVPLATATAALARFEGVRRRQDLLFEARGVRVYDDFAHHPTAVDETLRALRARHAEGALWAVFEPRSATACRALHQEPYTRAFGSATRVVFAPLGRPDIPAAERLDLDKLTHDLGARGIHAEAAPSVDAIVELIAAGAKPGDTVALLSNGAFGGIYDKLRVALGSS
jgi:UDP-N-acetylmuramate: L-alanyl-gamma-D-glutamyl-meso-diaminopimelate ligase